MEKKLIYLRAAWRMWKNEISWRGKRLFVIRRGRTSGLAFWNYPTEERYHWCVKLVEKGPSDFHLV